MAGYNAKQLEDAINKLWPVALVKLLEGRSCRQLEDALGDLWDLVEPRLTDEDRNKLGIDLEGDNSTDAIFDELHCFGSRGPAGIGLGRFGGHAVGD